MPKAESAPTRPAITEREVHATDGLLALDPSSTAIGHVLFRAGKIASGGIIESSHADPTRRVDAMLAKLGSVVAGIPNSTPVVMEVNRGREFAWQRKVGGRSKATTSTLCFSQGRVNQFLRDRGFAVAAIPDSEWTRKGAYRTKDSRRAYLRAAFPEMEAVWLADRGGDYIDAVMVGLYAIGKAREAELLERAR